MRNIWLIARREYLERVRTKGFLIATILIPLLMSGGIAASILIAKHSKSSSHIVIVTPDMQLGSGSAVAAEERHRWTGCR